MVDLSLYSGFLLFLDISGGELLIIMIAIFIVFGPQRIPELARKVGKGINDIKQATNKIKSEISEEVKDVTDTVKDVSDTVNETTNLRKNVRSKYNEKVKETPQPEVDPYENLEKEKQQQQKKEEQIKKESTKKGSGKKTADNNKDKDTIKNK